MKTELSQPPFHSRHFTPISAKNRGTGNHNLRDADSNFGITFMPLLIVNGIKTLHFLIRVLSLRTRS